VFHSISLSSNLSSGLREVVCSCLVSKYLSLSLSFVIQFSFYLKHIHTNTEFPHCIVMSCWLYASLKFVVLIAKFINTGLTDVLLKNNNNGTNNGSCPTDSESCGTC